VAERDVGRVGLVGDVPGDPVVPAGRGRSEDGDPDGAVALEGVAAEAVGRPAALEQDPELAEEVHRQVLHQVAVGANQVHAAAGEEPHHPVADGHVVVAAAVVDPDLVGIASRDDLAADGVAVQVDGDAAGPDDQPVPGAVEQVGGERGVLGDHRPAAQRLRRRRGGAEREQGRQEDEDDECAEGERRRGM
jgi:hypothetical protein